MLSLLFLHLMLRAIVPFYPRLLLQALSKSSNSSRGTSDDAAAKEVWALQMKVAGLQSQVAAVHTRVRGENEV